MATSKENGNIVKDDVEGMGASNEDDTDEGEDMGPIDERLIDNEVASPSSLHGWSQSGVPTVICSFLNDQKELDDVGEMGDGKMEGYGGGCGFD